VADAEEGFIKMERASAFRFTPEFSFTSVSSSNTIPSDSVIFGGLLLLLLLPSPSSLGRFVDIIIVLKQQSAWRENGLSSLNRRVPSS